MVDSCKQVEPCNYIARTRKEIYYQICLLLDINSKGKESRLPVEVETFRNNHRQFFHRNHMKALHGFSGISRKQQI